MTSRVVSKRIELTRFGGADVDEAAVTLAKGQDYLRAVEDEAVVAIAIDAASREATVRTELGRLRERDSGEDSRRATLDALASLANKFLGDHEPAEDALLQLDVVVTSAEVGIIPFEAYRIGARHVAESGQAVVTRRIRGAFAERPFRWPTKPRILFAHASPAGAGRPVPADGNKAALKQALAPWLGPLEGTEPAPAESKWMTVLPEASLATIHAACEAAANQGRPYTHVHLLAHGIPVVEPHVGQYFGVALHANDSSRRVSANATELADALTVGEALPFVVTLAVCDSGNDQDVLTRGSSLVHGLHARGIPLVVASQLPLTFGGSRVMTQELYTRLLRGTDVRIALAETRKALYARTEENPARFDWLTMVAYCRLPEGYAADLRDVRLAVDLGHMEAFGSWFEHLSRNELFEKDDLVAHAEGLIKAALSALEGRLEHLEGAQRGEAFGLYASGHKQHAELEHRRGREEQSRELLAKASAAYQRAVDFNLSHFWTGTQALVLQAVTEGAIGEAWRWSTYEHAARGAAARASEVWAFGSLLELHLLAPFVGRELEPKELDAISKNLIERVRAQEKINTFPLHSTSRQLRRYVRWWTPQNGYWNDSEHAPAVLEHAERLAQVLEEAAAEIGKGV